MLDEKSVWTEYVSARAARRVARALKNAGYSTATIAKCRGYAINIARYFEPGNAQACQELLDLICQAAGIQPRRT
jgi:hypothetical protein